MSYSYVPPFDEQRRHNPSFARKFSCCPAPADLKTGRKYPLGSFDLISAPLQPIHDFPKTTTLKELPDSTSEQVVAQRSRGVAKSAVPSPILPPTENLPPPTPTQSSPQHSPPLSHSKKNSPGRGPISEGQRGMGPGRGRGAARGTGQRGTGSEGQRGTAPGWEAGHRTEVGHRAQPGQILGQAQPGQIQSQGQLGKPQTTRPQPGQIALAQTQQPGSPSPGRAQPGQIQMSPQTLGATPDVPRGGPPEGRGRGNIVRGGGTSWGDARAPRPPQEGSQPARPTTLLRNSHGPNRPNKAPPAQPNQQSASTETQPG